ANLLEELGQVLLVGCVLAGVAGRANPGLAAEPVSLDARGVGDRGATGRGVGGARLAERVIREALPLFGGQLDARRQGIELDAGQRLAQLAELVLVAGCEQECRHRRSGSQAGSAPRADS